MGEKHAQEMTIAEAYDLGCGMARHGNHLGAIGVFKGILEHEPTNWDVTTRLGASLFEAKRWHEAFWVLWRAREACPRDPKIIGNYASVLSQLGEPEKAIPEFERACAIAEKKGEPDGVKALTWNNLGNTLERVGRYKDAEVALRKGIAYDPHDPFPYYNLGITLMRLNRHAEGLVALYESIKLQGPVEDSASRLNAADALYNIGIGNLLYGNFRQGWQGYEYRLLTSENECTNLGLNPDLKWKIGDSIAGKRILVHCEQGVGDAIMFMRFVKELRREDPAEIMLVAHRALRHLVKIDGVRVLNPGEKIVQRDSKEAVGIDIKDTYDCWVAQMSLPLYLGLDTEEKIKEVPPWWCPVLSADVDTWSFMKTPNKLNVGVCWAGFFKHKNDLRRSIPLEKFKGLFASDANFISVQQIRPEEHELMGSLVRARDNLKRCDFTDFKDTAAALFLCDLIVTADTSVAHMAGTLGLKTWVLIPKCGTDWRWQLGERTDTPWYPNMTLYRQERDGDWNSVLDRVARDLKAMVAQRATA